MVIANITDSVILGIDWLEKQRAVNDLSDYSIRLNGQNILSVMINVKIYRVKTRKKIVITPYTKHISIVEFDKKLKKM